MSARSLFIDPENVSFLRGAMRLPVHVPLTPQMLARWYDAYMIAREIEPSKIDDVQTWADYMSTEYVRAYMGNHNVTAEQVPMLPYDVSPEAAPFVEMDMNRPMIKQRGPYGRFPKFNLPSAVEDGVAPDGSITIHTEPQTVRIFQPITYPGQTMCGKRGMCTRRTHGWRFSKADPRVMRRIAGHRDWLYDADDNGTLYDWEVLHRPHTRYPMDDFFSRQL